MFLLLNPFLNSLMLLSDSCSLRSARIIFGPTRAGSIFAVNYFVEGRGEVKFILLREGWLKAGERWLNGGSNASKRGRWASMGVDKVRDIENWFRFFR